MVVAIVSTLQLETSKEKAMIHKCKCILPKLVGLGLIVAGICLAANGTAFGQGTKTVNAALSNAHQPLYEAYRGVRIGMTAEEVRRKLGAPTHIAGNQDLYMISDNETAQIAYDNSHQVITISADYMGGVGAPDSTANISSGHRLIFKRLSEWAPSDPLLSIRCALFFHLDQFHLGQPHLLTSLNYFEINCSFCSGLFEKTFTDRHKKIYK